jgi:glucuronokinase
MSDVISEVAYPRCGLIGNPSDLFNGRTLSFLFDAFKAELTLTPAPVIEIDRTERDARQFSNLDELVKWRQNYGYYGGIRIIEAAMVRFRDYCHEHNLAIDPERCFRITYSSTIPFGCGLGGSSAIARATLAALMRFYGITSEQIPLPVQANIILSAETEELGITAGPQDRVVVVYGGLVFMDFTVEAYERNFHRYGDYAKLDAGLLPRLYVAYSERFSEPSGKIHGRMAKQASDDQRERIREAMKAKAELVLEARATLEAGHSEQLGVLMTRDFELRRSVYNVSADTIRMINTARANSSHTKQCGSGGAILGTYTDEAHLDRIRADFTRIACRTVTANPVDYV